jgi:hypothetical protein
MAGRGLALRREQTSPVVGARTCLHGHVHRHAGSPRRCQTKAASDGRRVVVRPEADVASAWFEAEDRSSD